MEDISLNELYDRINKSYVKHVDQGLPLTVDSLQSTLNDLTQCSSLVASAAIFSKNEELEDISTSSLKASFQISVHLDG